MEKKTYPSDALERYIVRFPDGMRERLKAAADANNRTLNAEIVGRLEASFLADASSISAKGKEIELLVSHISMRGAMFELRADLLKTRLESIEARIPSAKGPAKVALLDEAALARAELSTAIQNLARCNEVSQAMTEEFREIASQIRGRTGS